MSGVKEIVMSELIIFRAGSNNKRLHAEAVQLIAWIAYTNFLTRQKWRQKLLNFIPVITCITSACKPSSINSCSIKWCQNHRIDDRKTRFDARKTKLRAVYNFSFEIDYIALTVLRVTWLSWVSDCSYKGWLLYRRQAWRWETMPRYACYQLIS